jgi:hypothetical protein
MTTENLKTTYADGSPVTVGDQVQIGRATCTVIGEVPYRNRPEPNYVIVKMDNITDRVGVSSARFKQIAKPQSV